MHDRFVQAVSLISFNPNKFYKNSLTVWISTGTMAGALSPSFSVKARCKGEKNLSFRLIWSSIWAPTLYVRLVWTCSLNYSSLVETLHQTGYVLFTTVLYFAFVVLSVYVCAQCVCFFCCTGITWRGVELRRRGLRGTFWVLLRKLYKQAASETDKDWD